MNTLRKYPENILVLLIFLFICIGIIFFIKEYNSSRPPEIKSENVTSGSISSLASFKLKNTIILGSKQKPILVKELGGTWELYFDLANGNIKVNSINISRDVFKIKEINKIIKILSIKLDPNYASVGKINLATGKIDLSVGIVLEMKKDRSSRIQKISLGFPFVGIMDRKTGVLNLSGEATIPPGISTAPVPVKVIVKAESL